jgi:hypothetical protein
MDKTTFLVMELPDKSICDLHKLWRQVFRTEPPPRSNHSFLVQRIAHQLQVDAYGGLALRDRKRLSRYLDGQNPRPDIQDPSRPLAGTILCREWRGTEHRVKVLPKGFEYNNVTYRSLTQIAKEITGTQWSGPVFFGLKRAGAKRGHA